MGGGAQTPPKPEAVQYFYPGIDSKVLGEEVGNVIKSLAAKAPAGTYVQPKQQPALNADFSTRNPQYPGTLTTIADWLAEAGYQHANNTYLSLLTAPTLPSLVPVVESISPASGPTTGATPVTITGTGFTPDSAVDFGVAPGTVQSISPDGTSITVLSPAGIGIVDVRVTNKGGTSPVVPSSQHSSYNDQFTYTA